jgi:hypothetical protein
MKKRYFVAYEITAEVAARKPNNTIGKTKDGTFYLLVTRHESLRYAVFSVRKKVRNTFVIAVRTEESHDGEPTTIKILTLEKLNRILEKESARLRKQNYD